MEKIVKELSDLTKDFDAGFYYDREELRKKTNYNIGRHERTIEIVKNMLDAQIDDKTILIATKIAQKELDAIKENIKNNLS